MTLQYTMFGGAVNVLDVEEKVRRVLERHPDARDLDKNLIVYLWLEEDGLADVLGDEALAERFTRWFIDQATYTETITRARRRLQEKGLYLPSETARQRRERRREAYHERFRRR